MNPQKELIVLEAHYTESMEMEVCRLAEKRVQEMTEKSLRPTTTKNISNERKFMPCTRGDKWHHAKAGITLFHSIKTMRYG